MSKILVEIKVPSIDSEYDMFVPNNIKIYELTELIKRTVNNLSNGAFVPGKNVLCIYPSGKPADINLSADELGISNGSTLMLI